MDAMSLCNVISQYEECPDCGSSYDTTDLQCSLENEIITITCNCGFKKRVDENNKEIN